MTAGDAGGARDAGGGIADGGSADDAGATSDPDGCTPTTWYADTDHDGYGDAESTTEACSAPDGYVADATDCHDGCDTCHPGGTETCDGEDNDCNGDTDEGVTSRFHRDQDGDGFGDPDASTDACETPDGYVSDDSDCDDDCDACGPGGTEVCDGADNDCDTRIDEDMQTQFFPDCDGDGYSGSMEWTGACAEPPAPAACPGGWTTVQPTTATRSASNMDWDCNDDDDRVYPGASAWHGTSIAGVSRSFDFDYDCDGVERMRYSVSRDCGFACRNGWIGSVPSCGVTASMGHCHSYMGMCTEGFGSSPVQQECR